MQERSDCTVGIDPFHSYLAIAALAMNEASSESDRRLGLDLKVLDPIWNVSQETASYLTASLARSLRNPSHIPWWTEDAIVCCMISACDWNVTLSHAINRFPFYLSSSAPIKPKLTITPFDLSSAAFLESDCSCVTFWRKCDLISFARAICEWIGFPGRAESNHDEIRGLDRKKMERGWPLWCGEDIQGNPPLWERIAEDLLHRRSTKRGVFQRWNPSDTENTNDLPSWIR